MAITLELPPEPELEPCPERHGYSARTPGTPASRG